jgi:ParB/RepB/Spo0J family partition protein
MVNLKNIHTSFVPVPFSNDVAAIHKAITSKLYNADSEVKKIVDKFIDLVNFEIQKKRVNTSDKKPNTSNLSTKKGKSTLKTTDYSGVKSMSLKAINVDAKRFQNRSQLNQAIVKNIVDNFKETDLDPLVIWKDPSDNKFYLLAGHHRHAALKKLGRKNVPVKVANNDYPTEKDAIRYAKELSNANRSLETPSERAKVYRAKIKEGATKKELEAAAAKEGKNRSYILNLAYLNEKGRVIESLERFDGVTDKQNTNEIEKQADWIGAARRQFTELTNSHESEMFTFLNDAASSKRMSTKSTFLQYVNSIAGAFDFDSSQTLNLKRFKYKSQGEQEYDSEVENIKDQIKESQDKINSINSRLFDPKNSQFVDPTKKTYSSIKKIADQNIAKQNALIKSLSSKLAIIYQAKSNYINAGSNQVGMFGFINKDGLFVPNNLPQGNNSIFEIEQKTVPKIVPGINISRAKELRAKGPVNPLFYIQGATGQFLGKLERKPSGSIIIALDAKQGAGKTTAGWKFMNDVAGSGHKVLFASLEEHPSSNLFQEKIDYHIKPQNVDNIRVIDDFLDYQDFKNLVSSVDYIFIDSWQKLEKMINGINMDQDIRNAFDGKVFLIIFQQTTTGRTKGGADKVFDADVVLKGFAGSSFNENYFIADKNRYTTGDITKIAYNVANHYVYDPTSDKNQDSNSDDFFNEEFLNITL